MVYLKIFKQIGILQPPCVFPEQLLPFIFLGGYIALAKDFHKPLLQNSETKIFKQKKILKKLFKGNQKKTWAF